jgi:AcrR family transcriptional regulator
MTEERILAAATRLFAALGYDGASTRMIAEAAGLNIATVSYHLGGKRDLYLAVMERAHRIERTTLEAGLAEFTPDPAGVHRLVDRYLDFCVEHPEIIALWVHRWLSDAEDIAHLEQEYARSLVDAVVATVQPVAAAGTDLEYAVMTVIWSTHGFATGGVPDAKGRRARVDDAAAVERFRTQLHRLAGALLGLPE